MGRKRYSIVQILIKKNQAQKKVDAFENSILSMLVAVKKYRKKVAYYDKFLQRAVNEDPKPHFTVSTTKKTNRIVEV